jgi:hypothetical protein
MTMPQSSLNPVSSSHLSNGLQMIIKPLAASAVAVSVFSPTFNIHRGYGCEGQ